MTETPDHSGPQFSASEGPFFVDSRTGLRRARAFARFNHLVFNRHGFVGPDLKSPKPERTLRLAFIGNSVTLDSHVSGNDATWPHLTCEALQSAFPDIAMDYLNGALPLYYTEHLAAVYPEFIAPFEPDIVFVQANDLTIDTAALARASGLYRGRHYTPSALAKRFGIWRRAEKEFVALVRLLRAHYSSGKLSISPDSLTNSFEQRLENVVRICRQRCPVVVLLTSTGWPRREQSHFARARALRTKMLYIPFLSVDGFLTAGEAYDRSIRAVADRNNVVLADVAEAVPGDGDHFIDMGHFREAGSRKMARYLSSLLASNAEFQSLLLTKRRTGRVLA